MGTARRWASFPASGGKDVFCASEQACTHGREGTKEEGRERRRESVCVSYLWSRKAGKRGWEDSTQNDYLSTIGILQENCQW